MEKKTSLLSLFLTFLKIGLFTFGGGYAMIALIEKEFVEKKKWIEHNDFMDMVVLAESTPGPIAINSATYLGHKLRGVWGSIIATIAVCIPSFIIIYLISLFFNAFMELTLVAYAFKGIQICVVYLILSVGIKMFIKMEKNVISISLVIASLVTFTLLSLFAVDFSTILFILAGAVAGIIFYSISHAISKRKSREEK